MNKCGYRPLWTVEGITNSGRRHQVIPSPCRRKGQDKRRSDDRSEQRSSEQGSATIWLLGLSGLLMVIATIGSAIGAAIIARHQVDSAADLAALAGADRIFPNADVGANADVHAAAYPNAIRNSDGTSYPNANGISRTNVNGNPHSTNSNGYAGENPNGNAIKQSAAEPCAAARDIARRNNSSLRSCRIVDNTIEIEVSHVSTMFFIGRRSVTAKARAGPVMSTSDNQDWPGSAGGRP